MDFGDFFMIVLIGIVASIFVGGFIFLFWTELRNEFLARGQFIERNKRFKE